ncbi:peptidase C14, caspase domain-containing protein [Hypoxylon trugodes]|uniref:peptidase C14, caspase domain-containing protein n=1 Tax=Hypoxylon trugodes TaxID=326681 RepID=UPI00219EC493|nr:peptidase C14, caspase domain-containing protein [Hypoxylon trugodes]KAI1385985.1 peptidase C14, caspase domain-containing protein [Hypoxylon trugodes]
MPDTTCKCTPSAVPGTRWAILIGIDYYVHDEAQSHPYSLSLRGCVNDVILVQKFLCQSTDIDPNRIHKLIASRPDQPNNEANLGLPSYENIVELFQHVTTKAKKGDLVYIHYSGHGARVRSIFSHLKENGGDLPDSLPSQSSSSSDPSQQRIACGSLDEALVPYNIANQQGRYLRDVEIAVMLRNMSKKELLVTTVIDCCHSGGMNRDGGNMGGISYPDRELPHTDHSSFKEDELKLAYSDLCRGKGTDGDRSARVGEHWLLGSGWKGQIFFAACGEGERAAEAMFGNKRYGVLTYFLVEHLNSGSDLSCDEISRLLKQDMCNKNQKPLLGGEKDRLFFRDETLHLFQGVAIEEVEVEPRVGSTIRLGVGGDSWYHSRGRIRHPAAFAFGV